MKYKTKLLPNSKINSEIYTYALSMFNILKEMVSVHSTAFCSSEVSMVYIKIKKEKDRGGAQLKEEKLKPKLHIVGGPAVRRLPPAKPPLVPSAVLSKT